MDWLLTLTPALTVLVTARRRPKWASARRILYGEITEIDRGQLAMTTDEAALVLDGRTTEQVHALVQQAEGWPALIGLAALSTTHELPTERVSEIKKGKKSETTRKFFPGYLIVNMHLLDENNQLVGRTWYFIRETPGVIGFAGTKDKPIPMRQSEVDSMLAQMKEREEKVKPKVSFEVGETVKVADGPFQNQNGIVEEIDPERGKLRVSVTIFGRATPVDLEYWQVERG